MYSAHKRLVVLLAVAVFGLGMFLRYTKDNKGLLQLRSSVVQADATTGQMAAYNPQGPASDVGVKSTVDLRPMETYYSVLRIIKDHYYERIQDQDEKKLTYSSIRIMLDSMKDPYTRFFDPDQAQVIDLARQGKFYGLGAVLAVRKEKSGDISNELLTVVSTLPGSPAEKAGLATGDVITELDGKNVLPYDPFQAAAKLIKSARNSSDEERMKLQKQLEAEDKRITNGISFIKAWDQLTSKDRKDYQVTVKRAGAAKPIKVKVTAAETDVDPITYAKLDKSTGYIRVRLMDVSSTNDFAAAIADLEKAGMTSLVLDLRDCPGGVPESAQRIASWFAPGKAFANVLLSHNRKQIEKIPSFQVPEGSSAKVWSGKTAVLIDEGTAGMAEVLAGALTDDGVAKTVGEPSFGQGIQQTYYRLKDGSAVSMTTGKYLTPSGKDFNLKGLAADVKVAGVKPQGGADPVVARAMAIVKAQ